MVGAERRRNPKRPCHSRSRSFTSHRIGQRFTQWSRVVRCFEWLARWLDGCVKHTSTRSKDPYPALGEEARPRASQISIATVNPNPPRTDVILNSWAHGRQRRKHTGPSVNRTSLFFLFHQPLLLRPDIVKLLLHKGSAHRPVCIEWRKTHIE